MTFKLAVVETDLFLYTPNNNIDIDIFILEFALQRLFFAPCHKSFALVACWILRRLSKMIIRVFDFSQKNKINKFPQLLFA